MKKLIFLTIIAVAIFAISTTEAGKIWSFQNGDWATGGNWAGGGVPAD